MVTRVEQVILFTLFDSACSQGVGNYLSPNIPQFCL